MKAWNHSYPAVKTATKIFLIYMIRHTKTIKMKLHGLDHEKRQSQKTLLLKAKRKKN